MHLFSLASLALLAGPLASAAPSSLPKVNLGYEIHQAIAFNATGQTYNFTNIRFAQPPVGKLRFKAPVPPVSVKSPKVTNGGNAPIICPQASPTWGAIGNLFSAAFIEGNATEFNLTQAEAELAAAEASGQVPTSSGLAESEDCLFLDVFVPKKVFDNKGKTGKKAAVLLWIYGGGYVLGWKGGDTQGNPSGLIKASQAGGEDGIIFVQINYRLGALGWLSGPTLEDAGGVSNAGLYDQRLAIEWVAKNIHLFGGDGKNITLIGESAGGGSIMHQITAYGGQKGVSFQGAIPQSPGWQPVLSAYKKENITLSFLADLGVSSIAEAQAASSKQVVSTNFKQILNSAYGTYTYGPVVDGNFVPANPNVLLATGSFAKDIKIMAGHNTNEGVAARRSQVPPRRDLNPAHSNISLSRRYANEGIFTDPSIRTDAQLEAFLFQSYPGIAPAVVSQVLKYYPAVYDGSMPYNSPVDRTIFIVTEQIFTCNTHNLAVAFGNKTYAYQFAVPPALHGFDIGYTFWNGAPTNISTIPPLIAPLAQVLQGYITNFAMTGNPNGKGLPPFPMRGANGTEVGLNVTINSYMKDPTDNERCAFLGEGLYN